MGYRHLLSELVWALLQLTSDMCWYQLNGNSIIRSRDDLKRNGKPLMGDRKQTERHTISACLDVGWTKLSYEGLTYRRYLQNELDTESFISRSWTHCSRTPSTLLPRSSTSLLILRASIRSESHWTNTCVGCHSMKDPWDFKAHFEIV
jgi:hypothetical protein